VPSPRPGLSLSLSLEEKGLGEGNVKGQRDRVCHTPSRDKVSTRCGRKACTTAVNVPPRYAEGHYSGHVIHVKKGVCDLNIFVDNVAGVRNERVQRVMVNCLMEMLQDRPSLGFCGLAALSGPVRN
jgi:hypothetical protein